MRSAKALFNDMVKQPPVLFPAVALFHVLWLIYALVAVVQAPGTATYISALWLLGYTAFWLAVADMRKWGSFGYIGIAIISIIIYFTEHDHTMWIMYESPIFPFDILFCFFILFYYKRFR